LHCTTHESKLALSSHGMPRTLLLVEMQTLPPGPHLAMNSAAVITCSLLLNQELLALAGRALEADFS